MCADYLRKMKEEPDSEDLLNIGIEGEKYKNQLKEELKAEILEQLEVEIEKRTIVHSAKIDSDTQTNYQENNAENSDVLYVSLVKDAILYNYPEKTIGEAINETLSTVQWKVSKGRNGTIYVSAQGEIINDVLYFGEQYHAMIQFKVNRDLAPYVGINTVQINSEPVSDNMLTEVLEFFFNQEAYIQHYKLRAACVKFEVEAQSASAAISDYFSEPDRIKVPTVEELKVASQYNPTYPVEIIGNTYENISILVIDSNNSCSSGIAYIYSFENGGKWIN
jgi:hypothetical protein